MENATINTSTLSLRSLIKKQWQLLLLILMLLLQAPSDAYLKQATLSPKGIVSLELAFSQEKAAQIKNQWQTTELYKIGSRHQQHVGNLLGQAKANIDLDFFFIVAYCIFLFRLNWKKAVSQQEIIEKKSAKRKKNLVYGLIILAGVMDCLENVNMLRFLSSNISPLSFAIPAAIKFSFLFIILLWGLDGAKWLWQQLPGLSQTLLDILSLIWISPLTAISIVVLFFTIWVSDQGQDLLLVVNNEQFGPFFVYLMVTILAFMNWHFPKFFYNGIWRNKETGDRKPFQTLFLEPFNYSQQEVKANTNKVSIPRLLGVLTFLVPAFGILKVLDVFEVGYALWFFSPLLWLILTTILIQRCLAKGYFNLFYKERPGLFYISLVTLLMAPVVFWPLNRSTPVDLQWLFWGLLCWGISFALVVSNRLELAQHFKWIGDKKITTTVWSLTIPAIATFAFYFLCNIFFWHGLSLSFLTLAVVLAAVISYYVLFTVLNVLGKIYAINFSLLFLLVMMAIPLIFQNDFHKVDVKLGMKGNKKIGLHDYLAQWVADRYNNRKDSVYPIYIVNSYGGGIRAAAWTCFTIEALDGLQKKKNGDLFQDHVLAYSGASGGTIGASILCANGFANHKNHTSTSYANFFAKDMLTPLLTAMIGNDIFGWNIWGNDRSKVQEVLWEQYFSDHFGDNSYSSTIDTLWSSRKTSVPLLFSNTCDLKFGRKGIFCPVGLDQEDFPTCTIVQDLLHDTQTLKLSTAAFLSARFPYISPAGGIDDKHYFLDGGTVENSGAETAMQLYRVLRKVLADSPKYAGKFKVHILSLKNTYRKDDSILEKRKVLSQLIAPITGAISVGISGNTSKAEEHNERYFTGQNNNDPFAGFYYRIEPTKEELAIAPYFFTTDSMYATIPLPLGWSISNKALERMQASTSQPCVTSRRKKYNLIDVVDNK